MAGPLDLPAGTYTVAITAADAADALGPGHRPGRPPARGRQNYTAVAHLDAAGAPTATLFTNDISTTAAGQGRLTVRHVAAAPAVDVVAGGTAVISNLTNPNEKVLDLPAGTVSASVTATGTTSPRCSARPTCRSPRAPARSSTPGAARPPRRRPWRSPRRPSAACTATRPA